MRRGTLSALGLTAVAAALVAVASAAPPPTSVTIGAARTTITYGGSTTVSGSIAPATPGEKVTVQSQACGQRSLAAVATVQTTATGAWSATVKPTTTTQYRARVKKVSSTALTVAVRPRVQLTKVATGRQRVRLRVRVTAAQSFAGKVVSVQRRRPTGTWATVRRTTLRPGVTTAAGVVSSATVRRLRASRGSRLRAVLAAGQAAPCYVSGVSNTVRVTR